MDETEARRRALEHLYGELAPREEEELLDHVDEQPEIREELRSFRKILTAYREVPAPPPPADAAAVALRIALTSESDEDVDRDAAVAIDPVDSEIGSTAVALSTPVAEMPPVEFVNPTPAAPPPASGELTVPPSEVAPLATASEAVPAPSAAIANAAAKPQAEGPPREGAASKILDLRRLAFHPAWRVAAVVMIAVGIYAMLPPSTETVHETARRRMLEGERSVRQPVPDEKEEKAAVRGKASAATVGSSAGEALPAPTVPDLAPAGEREEEAITAATDTPSEAAPDESSSPIVDETFPTELDDAASPAFDLEEEESLGEAPAPPPLPEPLNEEGDETAAAETDGERETVEERAVVMRRVERPEAVEAADSAGESLEAPEVPSTISALDDRPTAVATPPEADELGAIPDSYQDVRKKMKVVPRAAPEDGDDGPEPYPKGLASGGVARERQAPIDREAEGADSSVRLAPQSMTYSLDQVFDEARNALRQDEEGDGPPAPAPELAVAKRRRLAPQKAEALRAPVAASPSALRRKEDRAPELAVSALPPAGPAAKDENRAQPSREPMFGRSISPSAPLSSGGVPNRRARTAVPAENLTGAGRARQSDLDRQAKAEAEARRQRRFATAETFYLQARDLYNQGQFDPALDRVTQAIRSAPDHPAVGAVYELKARTEYLLGRYASMSATLERLRQVDGAAADRLVDEYTRHRRQTAPASRDPGLSAPRALAPQPRTQASPRNSPPPLTPPSTLQPQRSFQATQMPRALTPPAMPSAPRQPTATRISP